MANETDLDLQSMDPSDLFTFFSEKAWDVLPIVQSFETLKEKLGLRGISGIDLYVALKSKLTHWKANTLWELLDKKVNLDTYKKQEACQGMRVLVVGCGPVGMRFAVEAALLGCDIIIVEKRPCFSRNNVLHLWPFTIDDLRRLGAKKFYGQFCAGAIDHISIRSLQAILLKVCLLLGVKIFFNVEFIKIKEPINGRGWHAEFSPSDHLLNEVDIKILVGAEGKNSRIPGFDRKELRAKLALAITANFVNHRTKEEAAVQEISGVAFIFNQKFFKDLYDDTGIDLENIVYYKDDTHYFIMTAKKDSLLKKGVLKKDYSDVQQLLAPSNRNVRAMYAYASEAADWSTELPHLDFALNHKGQPDVDLFDFTSVYQAEYAAKAIRRGEDDLLVCLVGDSLVQPFWPQGTGCARGFLSALDAAWMLKGLGEGRGILDLLAERESLFQRLTQTKSENLMKKHSAYTIDPRTRYPNLNLQIVKPSMIKHLYDFDGEFPLQIIVQPQQSNILKENTPPTEEPLEVASPVKKNEPRPKPPLLRSPSKPVNQAGQVTRALYGAPEEDTKLIDKRVLLSWFQEQVKSYGIRVNDLGRSFRDGLVLCSIIYRYNPELIPEYSSLSSANPLNNNKLAFSLADAHYGIPQLLKASEMDRPDRLALFTYLSNFYEVFQNLELPEQPKEISPERPPKPFTKRRSTKKLLQTSPSTESWNTHTSSLRRNLSPRKSKKEKKKDNEQITEAVTKKQENKPNEQLPIKSATPNSKTGATAVQRKNGASSASPRPVSTFGAPTVTSDVCFFCEKKVYLMERMSANGVFFHRHCFRCSHCNTQLSMGNYALSKGDQNEPSKFFCKPHYRQLFLANPEAINYARSQPNKKSPSSISPPTSPTAVPLTTIGEDEVVTLPEKKEEEEEEVFQRKRTLTQRLSAFWKRRSRSKSVSPEKKSASPEIIEKPAVEETPPTSSAEETPPTSPPPTSLIPIVVETPEEESGESPVMPFRQRSPPVLLGRPGSTPPPHVENSPLSTLRKGRGQKSVVRPLLLDDKDEIALEKRQKQQERFREAQTIQREMSQIELQYEELEEIAREIEQNLRDAEGTNQEDNFMKAWLNLVAERNSLVRRTSELSMQMKILELEDRQYEIEKELRDQQEIMGEPSFDETYFDKLVNELVEVVEERDNIIQQVEMDRVRELEEEEVHSAMMSDRFGLEPTSIPERDRRTSDSAVIEMKVNVKKKRNSWWLW